MTIREQAFAGLPLDIPVIDAHTHTGPKYRRGWHQNPDYTSLDSFIAMYDKLGINCCVNTPHPLCDSQTVLTNKTAAEESARYPGRIYSYIYIAPFEGWDVAKQNIATYSKNPAFVGVKFLGGYQGKYTDPIYLYAADFANEVGCPLLCHNFGGDPPLEHMIAFAEKRPNLNLLLAHQGGGYAERTDAAAPFVRDMPNVYMELCGSLYNTYSFEDIRQMVGEDKMIFGTDAIDLDVRFEFGRLAFSTMPDSAKKKIFAGNYLKLLEKSQLGKIVL